MKENKKHAERDIRIILPPDLAVIDERDCYSTRIEAEDALGGEE